MFALIFVTVGTQYPFDRLLAEVDAWAAMSGERVVAQVGGSNTEYENLETVGFIPTAEFESLLDEADLVVSHAGMGTIIACALRGKPLIVLPRRHALGEHTDDHQVESAARMERFGLAKVVQESNEIIPYLTDWSALASEGIGEEPTGEILESLREFAYRDQEASEGRRGWILGIASQGGHWTELQRLRHAFQPEDIQWVTTKSSGGSSVREPNVGFVRDADLQRKFHLMILLFQVFWKILIIRPKVIVSTGAAPGWFAVVFGRLFGARSVWIDSIANPDRLSLSGKKARRWADEVWTQWPDRVEAATSSKRNVEFKGNVL
jgi:UDP-N-acetylglucosamine transferase subunit ALG13